MTIRHKHRYPDFFTPKRVPLMPVEVDWQHPLSRGLVCCFVPGGASGFDNLADYGTRVAANNGDFAQRLTPGSAGALVSTSIGPGLDSRTASGGASGPGGSNLSAPVTTFTLGWAGDYFGATGGSNLESMLMGVSASAARPAQFMNHNSGLIFAYTQTGFIIRIQSNHIPASGFRALACTFTLNGTALIYSEGVQVGSGAITTMTGGWNNSPTVDLGASLTRANPVISCIGTIWTRVLTPDEITWVSQEPFAMLRPVAKRVYYNNTVASGGGITFRGVGSIVSPGALAALAGAAAIRRNPITTRKRLLRPWRW